MNAELIEVIDTDLDLRGDGTPDDPIRRIRQFWTTDGRLLAEVDPYAPNPEKVKAVIVKAAVLLDQISDLHRDPCDREAMDELRAALVACREASNG